MIYAMHFEIEMHVTMKRLASRGGRWLNPDLPPREDSRWGTAATLCYYEYYWNIMMTACSEKTKKKGYLAVTDEMEFLVLCFPDFIDNEKTI